MATFTRKSFAQFVQDQAAAVQAACATLIDFTVGSIELALIEANTAGVGLWLQRLIYKVLLISRLATSSGDDVDSFLAQFDLSRLPARAATGLVTFNRLSVASSPTILPVGSLLKTGDGSQSFVVTVDLANPAYSADLNGYIIPAGSLSVTAPVSSITPSPNSPTTGPGAGLPGANGNVAAGAISVAASQMPGIDNFSNAAALTNGLDAQKDADCKAAFVLFIGSLSKATPVALRYAITSLQQGLQVAIHEGVNPDGSANLGFVTIFVDDGSGAPYAGLVSACGVAVDAVRAAGIRVGVFPASLLPATVALTIQTAPGYDHPTLVATVASAVAAFVNSIGLENPLPLTRIIAVAYGVPGVTNVSGVSVNGSAADLVPGAGQTIKMALAPVVS